MSKVSHLYLDILPDRQKQLFHYFLLSSKQLNRLGFYLGGGTALALQIGHRCSVDFDFFSKISNVASKICSWLEKAKGYQLRDRDAHTVHVELQKIKVSFIGGYKYSLMARPVKVDGLRLASIEDIGLMKLLAIVNRTAFRDYLDLAAIIDHGVSLKRLLDLSRKKYGNRWNPLVAVKALVSYEDLIMETPLIHDKKLAREWKWILRKAVQGVEK